MLMEMKVSFWDDKNVVEPDSANVCTTLEYTKHHWITNFK